LLLVIKIGALVTQCPHIYIDLLSDQQVYNVVSTHT